LKVTKDKTLILTHQELRKGNQVRKS